MAKTDTEILNWIEKNPKYGISFHKLNGIRGYFIYDGPLSSEYAKCIGAGLSLREAVTNVIERPYKT